MPTRQKSFFEQKHSAKVSIFKRQRVERNRLILNEQPRPEWHRSKSTGSTARDQEFSRKSSKTAVPIAPSTQARTKLNAFILGSGIENIDIPALIKNLPAQNNEEDKENLLPGGNGTCLDSEALKGRNLSSSQKSANNELRDCPKTPASGLALSDLIGTGIDFKNQENNAIMSPSERIYWKHMRSPNSSTSIAGPSSSRPTARKRARSSSPLCSPEISKFKEATSFNMKSLNRTLRTPQADPAIELWNRYATTVSKDISPGYTALPEFLLNGSPQTPAHGAGKAVVFGLARSKSCGMEWPTSAPKRRRITLEKGIGEGTSDSQTLRERFRQAASHSSKVSLLVEKLQQELPRLSDFSGPSSSSPLPGRRDLPIIGEELDVNTSPLGRMIQRERILENKDPGVVRGEGTSEGPQMETHDAELLADSIHNNASSEFGDFDDEDLDLSLLDSVDLATKPLAPELSTRLDIDEHKIAEISSGLMDFNDIVRPDSLGQEANSTHPQADLVALNEEFDEFDDGDEDEYAAVMQDFVSKCDASYAVHQQENEKNSMEDGNEIFGESEMNSSDFRAAENDTLGILTEDSDGEFGEFGEDDLEQLVAIETATSQNQKLPSTTTSNRKIRVIKRYQITNVMQGEWQNAQGQVQPAKILLVQDEKTGSNKVINLRDSWVDTPCTSGSYIHIIGEFTHDGRCTITDTQNMLILNPDFLISSTVVADSFGCTRRAVIQDRVKATGEASEPQVYGHLLHEIFQEALAANRWDTEWLDQLIEKTVEKHLEDIYQIKLGLLDAANHLKGKMAELQAWAKLFISARPKAGGLVKDRNGATAAVCINKLLDVEEHVWSPMYGLKGNIDATVQITIQDSEGEQTLSVPFELKTGKHANAAHRAQTALYTLLLSDRYDINVACGILYHMEMSEMSRIPAIRHELVQMIIQRNELSCFVRNRLQLPPMVKNTHLCKNCYAKVPCFLYEKLVNDGDGSTTGLRNTFDSVVKHVKPEHQEFFRRWDGLLTKEEKDMFKFRRELWTMLSSEREKLGRCFSNVVIEPGSNSETQGTSKINRYQYSFVKECPTLGFSFFDSQIIVGEPIVISDEKGHFALANGYVTQVRKQRISVAVDRRLHNARIRRPGFDAENNQVFSGIMQVEVEGIPTSPLTQEESEKRILYRLDKDEFSNGMATVRNNLIQVMSDGPFGSREIRSLVVEGNAPKFKTTSTAYTISEDSDKTSLNVDQVRAIEKVMSAKDYALVLGMPGTGKTTTIAHIIRALVSQGKSVLLTSYTHSAVDNILLKLASDGFSILRLGAVAKVHPVVQEFAILAGTPKKTIEEIQDAYHSPKVVATTCLGINHPVFGERIFDYCIVDEASQITLPVCLGPIRLAKTFILVGDHNQLPPLVQNEEARVGGLDISLFKLLSDQHPESVVNLEHQYRMCEDIMTLSNTLIYNGHLKCGTESVASRSLTIPNMNALHSYHHTATTSSALKAGIKNICLGPQKGLCWLRDLLDPAVKAAFINTDSLLPASREVSKGSRIVNSTEVELTLQLVEALLSTGVPGSEIGVMSPYRSQLSLLRNGMQHQTDVEMHTADRFQGRDKEVVVLSLVRSNETGNIGDLLKDWRRVNVAITRAKSKLLVIGSRTTLKGGDDPGILGRFIELMDQKGWVYDLPAGAPDMHFFQEDNTQATASAAGLKDKSPSKPRGQAVDVKVGRIDQRFILGNRPVLRDILNDQSY
ncbi:MAG: Tripartite DNA replication factor [Trizodia sp. TS-e1964]|nr:MAG: Tripartite DNA replication factor [Trizodia sp. TS-e1964]